MPIPTAASLRAQGQLPVNERANFIPLLEAEMGPLDREAGYHTFLTRLDPPQVVKHLRSLGYTASYEKGSPALPQGEKVIMVSW